MKNVLKLLAAGSVALLVAVVSISYSIGTNHVPSASAAQSDYYLKLDGVAGEIEINSWSWGATSTRDVATGQSSGKRQHKPIYITKEWDANSPLLLNASNNGTRYKSATLTRRSSGGTPAYTVVFQDVLVSGFQHDGDAGSAPTESVSFTYQKIEMK